MTCSPRTRLASVRPLVRYVDHDQAVIEAHFTTLPAVSLPSPIAGVKPSGGRVVDVEVEVDGSDGFHDEGRTRVTLDDHRGRVRFEMVRPRRWWPAGMGEQALYRLTLTLDEGEHGRDARAVTFGLTSVRRDRVLGEAFDPSLLVNGQICDIDAVIPVDRVHESGLLPAAGDSLLLVRDHYGPNVLYDAADRAGILLIQCVPVPSSPPASSFKAADHEDVERTVVDHVARLSAHPSLAGYFVGHLGALTERVAAALRACDPTRPVFRRYPLYDAA
ncbi:MAG: hypothetical protein AAFX76_03605 [Planctomycetota bacterium]